MNISSEPSNTSKPQPSDLPFVAPCRRLDVMAPLRWLRLGWQDFKRAPRQSLTYGLAVVVISYLVSIMALTLGTIYSLLSLLSGFILLGPVIAIGLYSISCQLQEGRTPRLGYCLRERRRHFSNFIVFGLMLLVVFLIWARAASMLHVFYPVESGADFKSFMVFLSIGSAVGAVFAAVIFTASAFSLPMIMDRKADMVTAVITSINAVLRNKLAMFTWAAIIVLSILLSFATAFLGFLVLLPVIGHGAWHAYQETIDAGQWPRHD